MLRGSNECARNVILTSILAGLLGCLPDGERPKGRQLIADRTVSGAFFSQSASDPSHSHLLVGGPIRSSPLIETGGYSYTTPVSDLYWIDVSDTAAPAVRLDQKQPVLRNLNGAAADLLANGLPRDSRGRLLLQTLEADPLSGSALSALYRYDPDKQLVEHLLASAPGMWAGSLTLSPGRTRALLSQGPFHGVLIDLDGQQEIDSGNGTFVGEDLYYVAGTSSVQPGTPPKESSLVRIRPASAPEVLLSQDGFMSIEAVQTGESELLFVSAQSYSSDTASTYLLDTATSTMTVLPSGYPESVSSDGRWILLRTFPDVHLILYDRTTGQIHAVLDDGQSSVMTMAEWRPSTDQLWVPTSGNITIWTEGGSRTLPGWPTTSCLGDFRYRSSMFNPDGSLWFSGSMGYVDSRLAVGWAEHPEDPPTPIQPEGTWVEGCWELEGHRLFLAAQHTGTSGDSDLYLFDPTSRETRNLTASSRVVQAGKSRALVLLEWEGWRSAGKLALVDYATGERSYFANDVARATVDSLGADTMSGTDPLAPGTRVAFISRNRLDSPDDGLWLAELP